jgi:tetratricopeptide (TPR) repeat protein
MAMTSSLAAPDIFQAYIAQNMRYALNKIEGLDDALPTDEEREVLLHALTFGLESPDAWPQTRRTLLLLAPKMEQGGYRGEWVTFLERGIRASQDRQDLETEAELRLQLGIMIQLLSQYDDADEQLAASLKCFTAMDSRRGEARVLNRQAWVARRKRQFDRSEELLDAALQRLDEEDDQRAYAHLVLGSVRFDQQRWQEAIALNKQALAIWEKVDDQRMQAWTHTNLGVAFRRSGHLEQAATHLHRALVLFDQVNDPVHRAVADMNLGGIFIDLDQPQAALNHFLEAERTFRDTQEQFRMAKIYNNIGHAYLALDQPQDAVTALESSVRLWDQIGGYELRRLNAITSLGIAYLEGGRIETAVDVFLHAQHLLPTIEREPQYHSLAQEIDEELQRAREELVWMENG